MTVNRQELDQVRHDVDVKSEEYGLLSKNIAEELSQITTEDWDRVHVRHAIDSLNNNVMVVHGQLLKGILAELRYMNDRYMNDHTAPRNIAYDDNGMDIRDSVDSPGIV